MRLKKPVFNTTCASRIFASRIFGDLSGPDRVLRDRLGIKLFIKARLSCGLTWFLVILSFSWFYGPEVFFVNKLFWFWKDACWGVLFRVEFWGPVITSSLLVFGSYHPHVFVIQSRWSEDDWGVDPITSLAKYLGSITILKRWAGIPRVLYNMYLLTIYNKQIHPSMGSSIRDRCSFVRGTMESVYV